jgi:hypothetical protein
VNPDVLPTILADVLAACAAAYTQEGAPPVPKRQFVTHGQAVASDEQLTVATGWVGPTRPFPLAQQRAVKSSVVGAALINVEVWRTCWPTAGGTNVQTTLPSPTKLQDAGLLLAADATTLFGWISTLAANGGLCPNVPGISTAEDVGLGQMVPLGPSATLAGWRWPITVKLSVLPR